MGIDPNQMTMSMETTLMTIGMDVTLMTVGWDMIPMATGGEITLIDQAFVHASSSLSVRSTPLPLVYIIMPGGIPIEGAAPELTIWYLFFYFRTWKPVRTGGLDVNNRHYNQFLLICA